jgi:hypothetical protein
MPQPRIAIHTSLDELRPVVAQAWADPTCTNDRYRDGLAVDYLNAIHTERPRGLFHIPRSAGMVAVRQHLVSGLYGEGSTMARLSGDREVRGMSWERTRECFEARLRVPPEKGVPPIFRAINLTLLDHLQAIRRTGSGIDY